MFSVRLRERIDADAARRLLFDARAKVSEADKALLRSLSRAHRRHGYLEVEYTDRGPGRLHSSPASKERAKFVPHFACGVPRRLRHALSGRLVHDIDIQCCHPALLSQICGRLGVPCLLLAEYVSSPARWRAAVAAACSVSADAAKELFNRAAYGGGVDAWAREYGADPALVPADVLALQAELTSARPRVLSAFPEFVQHQQQAKPDHWNPEPSAVFFVLADAEKRCLVELLAACRRQGLVAHSLMHDGLTVERRSPTDSLPDDVLRSLESSILSATGFRVTLTEKAMPTTLLDDLEVVFVQSDHEAALHVLEKHRGRLVQSTQRTWLLTGDNLWTDRRVETRLLALVQQTDMVLQTESGECRVYSRNASHASQIVRSVLASLPTDAHFEDDLWTSTLGKLFFADGHYDFSKGAFVPNSDESARTPVRIERPFPARDPAAVDRVRRDILQTIFPDPGRRSFFLGWCARCLAGHVEDKEWMICLGERNAGKGVLVYCFKAAFGEYVGTFNSESFLYRTNLGDAAKERSWMLDHEFRRLIFSSECHVDPSRGVKLNGNAIKGFISDGDFMVARKNFRDEVSFRVQCRMVLMANDLPDVRPADALQTMVQVQLTNAFVPVTDPRVGGATEFGGSYLPEDPSIKRFCGSAECADAFLHIVLEHYVAQRVPRPQSVVDDTASWAESDSVESALASSFEITRDPGDAVPCQDVQRALCGEHVTEKRLGMKLRRLGVERRKVRSRWCYVGLRWGAQAPPSPREGGSSRGASPLKGGGEGRRDPRWGGASAPLPP